jgi:hypothetical protein
VSGESQSVSRGPIGYRLAHELEGILQGISSDGIIHRSEAKRLVSWVSANAAYSEIRPFSELVNHIEKALSDGVLTSEECADLIFVVSKYTTMNPYVDTLRGGIQQLMGFVTGVVADRRVNQLEIAAMTDWLEYWAPLRGLWPYDECYAIVTSAMASMLLPAHVEQLHALAAQLPLAGRAPHDDIPFRVAGICAVAPSIEFHGKTFVFTGESARGPREQLATIVTALGGHEESSVTARSDYLVVCDGGNEFWAFACYGRKVETAYEQRRMGHRIVIVHERDFWDALVGHGLQ